jgi:integrase/recombinase XerD
MENGNIAPTFTIRMLKTDKKIKPTYNNEELSLLLKKPNKDKCNFTDFRIWALSNYLLATGNRISSALDLRICDIDFTSGIIQINKTKNRKSQLIPLSKALEGVLNEYLSIRGGEPTDYIFCNSFGEKGDMRSYEELIAKYNTKRGITKTSAHLYRHTFAKNWILNGGDIFRLQKILGHSDLTVVKEYVNMFSNDLSIDFDKFNPLDNLNINISKKTIHMK